MKFRNTVVLLAIFALMAGYMIWSGEQQSDSVPDGDAAPAVLVFNLDPALIDALEIATGGTPALRLERMGTAWTLKTPAAGPADTIAVTGVISELATLEATRAITSATTDLVPYGLATPVYELNLWQGTTLLGTLRVGEKNPEGVASYVQRDADPAIYLVTNFALTTVQGWLTSPPIQPTPAPTPPPLTIAPAETQTSAPGDQPAATTQP